MNRSLRSVFGLGLVVVLLLTAYAVGQSTAAAPATDPLVRVLVDKGVLTAEEGRTVGTGSAAEQREKLAGLLKDKGIITAAEFESLRTPPAATRTEIEPLVASVSPVLPPPSAQKKEAAKAAAPPAPAVIPAVAPIRVLQLEGSKPGGLVPDLKLGSGAKLKLYGFYKTSVVYDTSTNGAGQANDFPLPGFLADTGPKGAPEFHLKARGLRIGTNFEWPDIAGSKAAITGRLEFDFEGNFTRANNRNVSSIRSSQPSLRLAWTRVDYPVGPNTNWYALFGQDWTPFGSSTLPNLVETTGLGIAFGSLYERAPQVRTGILHTIGGPAAFKLGGDFALALPGFGNVPPVIGAQTVTLPATFTGGAVLPVATGPGNLGEQLAFGERQGEDSQKPELEARLLLQFQVDKAKGVAPAQIIVSGVQSWRRAIVLAANVPAAFKAAFPNGAQVDSQRHGVSGEFQLPTRYLTLIGKAYTGSDLRWFFAGQLFSHYNDLTGITGAVTAPSIDGSDSVAFAAGCGGVCPQRPVRAYGGFVNLGFPLSRIANANPAGRNAGWTLYLHYGLDGAFANDLRKQSVAGQRAKSDLMAGNIQYKLNQFVTFAYEQSYYRTFAKPGTAATAAPFVSGAGWPTFRGIGAREWHDVRSEFATIFTF